MEKIVIKKSKATDHTAAQTNSDILEKITNKKIVVMLLKRLVEMKAVSLWSPSKGDYFSTVKSKLFEEL